MNNSKMIHSQGRELIYGVYQFMKKEKEEGEPVIFLSNLREKVAAGTGVSLSTVKRIIKKGKNKPEGATFSSPRKTIEKPSPKSDLDQFDEEIIRTYCLYAVDNLLAKHGHTVLRLPPYHPVINPIEKIWALIKNRVAARNTTFKLNDVRSLVVEEFNAVTVEDWQKVCAHVMEIEEKFMSQERII
ncbi:hypothetical protein ILUMI_12502 [Ignelater luminosus]|uniref:Tc1-like transposase DDE domain-containing protein n=1 Tax=Ignelater luminosus TaxID=2038154 RepID=A0A8K0CYG0_IGNLU|nr:hypothetical protein ILUMI_12502 [Ignelater luminosus]